jgi:signal transduction histidine kinase
LTRGSLRLRLLIAAAISVIAALVLSAIGLSFLFERQFERRVATELSMHLDQIVAGLERNPDGKLIVAKPPADPRFDQPISGLYWQIEIDSKLLRSRSLWDSELSLPPDSLSDGQIHQHQIPGPGGEVLLVIERSVLLPKRLAEGSARVAVGLDNADVLAARRAFTSDLVPYLLLMAVLLISASWIQVTVGLRPLAAVRGRLAAIRSKTANRLGTSFPDEVRPLAKEVDLLLEAQEEQLERARVRAGNLAHGLKTPLQVLAGDVARLHEKGETSIAGSIDEVANAMRQHVDRELARARLGTGNANASSSIHTVVNRVLSVAKRTPDSAQLSWEVDIPNDLSACIDPDDLAEALGNLIENAARHARTEVQIRGLSADTAITITVADDGPGIQDERLPEALSRGGRLDSGGSGAGLGLAIVRDIADAWHGQLEISNGPHGLEARLTLPHGARS